MISRLRQGSELGHTGFNIHFCNLIEVMSSKVIKLANITELLLCSIGVEDWL